MGKERVNEDGGCPNLRKVVRFAVDKPPLIGENS